MPQDLDKTLEEIEGKDIQKVKKSLASLKKGCRDLPNKQEGRICFSVVKRAENDLERGLNEYRRTGEMPEDITKLSEVKEEEKSFKDKIDIDWL